MRRTKLKTIVCLALSLFVLLMVPSLTSFAIESAYAMGWEPPPPDPAPDPGQGDTGRGRGGRRGGNRHSSAPEPSTLLLIATGAGAGGLVLLRKKLKK
jgi:hypothetical protein